MTKRTATSALFFAPSAYPLGGVQTWLDYLIPGLQSRGWGVSLALASGRFHDVERYLNEHPGLSATSLVNATGSRQGRVNAIASLVAHLKPDVVVSANIADAYAGVAQARRKNPDLKTLCVMTIHAIQPDFIDDVARDQELIEGVICTNKLTERLVQETDYPAERTLYAPYGVLVPSAGAHTSRSLAEGEAIRIAYVGRFDQWQKRLLDIAPICDGLAKRGISFELWIAGGGPDEALLRTSLAAHDSCGRVKWLGQVRSDEVAARVYMKVDVLLNPSFWETGPIVAWEAMAYGVVVASSRYVGSGLEAALVDNENCVLFDIGDTARAAAQIASLFDEEKRNKIIRHGHQLIGQRYSITASVDSFEKSLRRLIELGVRSNCSGVQYVPSHGRLDRILGTRAAEKIRRIAKREFAHSDAGGEWPHSYGSTENNDNAFWTRAKLIDAR
jgi:glycosyltransferase involved in cell wall biosynthesis